MEKNKSFQKIFPATQHLLINIYFFFKEERMSLLLSDVSFADKFNVKS